MFNVPSSDTKPSSSRARLTTDAAVVGRPSTDQEIFGSGNTWLVLQRTVSFMNWISAALIRATGKKAEDIELAIFVYHHIH